MTASASYDTLGRDDPLYREALTHVQAGEWPAAIKALETLKARHPEGGAWIDTALEDVRFKAKLDSKAHVRPKQSFVRWRPLLIRGLIIALLAVVVILGVQFISGLVSGPLRIAQENRSKAALLASAQQLLAANELDAAEAKFNEYLGRASESEGAEARAGKDEIQRRRGLVVICGEANALYESDDPTAWLQAREKYQSVQGQENVPCDATLRIGELNGRLQTQELATAADAAYQAGECPSAVELYLALRTEDSGYNRSLADERLFDCYVRLGRAITDQDPPALERISEALNYLTKALEIRPRDADVQGEQRLAGLFLSAQQAAEAGRWDEAAQRYEAIYTSRPGYLGGSVAPPLYDAYIRNGDSFRDSGDCAMAYDYYRRAAALNTRDRALALARQESIRVCLTPTLTPTITPTPSPIPTATPYVYVPPTAIPSATPPAPLASYRGQVVFKADKPGYEGFWAMNPDGSNKRFVGNTPELQVQLDALWEKERLSPDGKCRVYATKDTGRGDSAQQIYYQCTDSGGAVTTHRVTNCTKLCYDPIWSPDGSRFVYVSQDLTSDDIWSVQLNSTEYWNYTPNQWEWEKHPSFSSDGRKIVFWSNREGTKQIYVMDANGQNLKKISGNAPWDEYDPIWVK